MVLLLLLPLAQYHLEFTKLEPLKGSYKKEQIKIPALALNNLRSESFQVAVGKEWKSNLGFKNWLVRLNNQINYTLFDKSNTNGTIVCKDNYQITEPEIKAFLGHDFIGDEKVKQLWDKIEFIKDTLQRKGISFFILITPGKASTYAEKIPDKYFDLYKSPKTNYNEFVFQAKQRKVKLFDAKTIIQNDQSYFEHPVFPKNGIHWSGNTVAKISDTLVDFIESISGLKTPNVLLTEGEKTVLNYRFTDYDIGEAMNLLWNISDDVLHYPEMTFAEMPKNKINTLGVGDSFIQSFFGFYPVLDSVFSTESNIWYYNELMGWPLKYEKHRISVKKLNLKKEVLDRDLVFVEITEENLKLQAYGFIDDLYAELKGENELEIKMKPLFEKLLNSAEVVKEAKRIAPIVGYSMAEMRHSIAKYKVKNNWLVDFDYEEEVERVIKIIKASENWFKGVKEKAIRRNEPIETTLRKEAMWVVNKKMK